MKKSLLFLLFTIFCFANGRCEKLEREIMKNSNVLEVNVGQYDKWSSEIYYANITLTNNRYIRLVEFNRNLSGNRLGIEYIGKDTDGNIEYEFAYGNYTTKIPDKKTGLIYSGRMNDFRTEALSLILNKEICTVNEIINNYDEIYSLTERLAEESPEDRTKRLKTGKIQDSPSFSNIFGNFENDECWGQVFATTIKNPDYYDMFLRE